MSARFRLALILVSLFASIASMADTVSGGPLDVAITGEVLSAVDSKTGDVQVLPGNKVRVRSRVTVSVRGFSNGSLREWLEGRLPLKVQGQFEREDKAMGLATRFKKVTFTLDATTLKCKRDETPEFRLCTASYQVSRSNTVDVPAGDPGEHVIALQMLPPTGSTVPIQMARGAARMYQVIGKSPTVSQNQFAGLPQP